MMVGGTESPNESMLAMMWVAGPVLQLTGGSLAYWYQVKGNDPQASDYVKDWQYVERWNWVAAAMSLIAWDHYLILAPNSYKW